MQLKYSDKISLSSNTLNYAGFSIAHMCTLPRVRGTQAVSRLLFITHRVQRMVGATPMAAMVQMMVGMERVVSRAAPTRLEARALPR